DEFLLDLRVEVLDPWNLPFVVQERIQRTVRRDIAGWHRGRAHQCREGIWCVARYCGESTGNALISSEHCGHVAGERDRNLVIVQSPPSTEDRLRCNANGDTDARRDVIEVIVRHI